MAIRSDTVKLFSNNQKAEFLHRIKLGHRSIPAWVLEGFQDLGLIDHKDNLTTAGERILSKSDIMSITSTSES